MTRVLVRTTLTVLCCLSLAATSAAQSLTGEITGRVLDSSGLGVPGASVTATNTSTGLARSTTTSGEGDYTITLLPPGIYTVSAELAGFKKAVASDITISVGMRRSLPFELEVGALTEQ